MFKCAVDIWYGTLMECRTCSNLLSSDTAASRNRYPERSWFICAAAGLLSGMLGSKQRLLSDPGRNLNYCSCFQVKIGNQPFCVWFSVPLKVFHTASRGNGKYVEEDTLGQWGLNITTLLFFIIKSFWKKNQIKGSRVGTPLQFMTSCPLVLFFLHRICSLTCCPLVSATSRLFCTEKGLTFSSGRYFT